MKNFMTKYFRFCPKTEKLVGIKKLSGFSSLLFPFIGLAAVIWILIRVIPKPSRLSYPCMRTAVPLASGFIGYIAVLGLSLVAFLTSRKAVRYYPVFLLGAFIVFAISGSSLVNYEIEQSFATFTATPNTPMGQAKGIFPGRVVWVHNPNATNENCNPNTYNHGYFLPENTNQAVVDSMVSLAIRNLTGTNSDSSAWQAIFQYHNTTRGKGAVDYSPGEKIFIKTNVVSAWGGNYTTDSLKKVNNSYYGVSETSPGMILAVLRQLVNVVGVADTDIYVGDPLRHIYKHVYEQLHPEFPNVHYLDNTYSTLGRERVVISPTARIHYSDRGTILRTNVWDASRPGQYPTYFDTLYTIFEKAEYIINLPQLKGHKRAGMTMFAKNNFGSHVRLDAAHLHNGLVAPREDTTLSYRKGYGLYRVQVDMMSHSLLGKKILVYLLDALWSTDYELDVPLKWKMAPFNNDYMSSVFASLDPVAIESVGYDFLRSEFTAARGSCLTVVQMDGVDDYLHQAADSANWAAGIQYDPDSTGTLFASLGVHEHWNNSTNMQYTRNLGTGNGIELLKVTNSTSVARNDYGNRPDGYGLSQNYPNPFNPSTTINYYVPATTYVTIKIFNINGQEIETLVNGRVSSGQHEIHWNAKNLASGVYFCSMKAGKFLQTKKLVYQK